MATNNPIKNVDTNSPNIIVFPELPMPYPTVDALVGEMRTFGEHFVKNVNNADMYYAVGILPHKTYLISGPPGTSKTFAVNAINNTINNGFYEKSTNIDDVREQFGDPTNFKLFMVTYDIGRYGTAYINMGSRTVQTFFDKAAQYSAYAPTLIVLDEADALLTSRTLQTQSHSEDRKTLETIMKNLQDVHNTPNMYVVMMTNLPRYVDTAIKRAGRVDKVYKTALPNTQERLSLVEHIIGYKHNKAGYKMFKRMNYEKISAETVGFSHADIDSVINSAIYNKVFSLITNNNTDMANLPSVYMRDFLAAIKEHKKSLGDRGNEHATRKIGYL